MLKIFSSRLQNLKIWFLKLGFWKKLIIIFTINTIVILIVMNILMSILFKNISLDIQNIAKNQKTQFISLSNSQVAQSSATLLSKAVQNYGFFINQVINNNNYFQQNSNIYISNQSSIPPYNPQLTQLFNTTQIDQTGIFFFNNSNVFYNQPYIDVVLSSLIGKNQINQIKRMNVIYQNINNHSQIFARTIPGTNDFNIPSIQSVSNRFDGLIEGYITASGLYQDVFTLSANPQNLLAVRSVQLYPTYRKLVQVQIFQSTLSNFLQKIYFFPSAKIVFVQLNSTPNSYYILNTLVGSFTIDLSTCLTPGTHQIIQDSITYKIFTVSINDSFISGSSPQTSKTQNLGSFRLILVVQKQQMITPDILLNKFLQNQQQSLNILIYGWSFVILVSTIGLAIVTGNYIFNNLKILSQKLQEYIKSPDMIHKIIFDLKQLSAKGILKKLIDNMITIIQKIQEKKKLKNQIKKTYTFPLNLAEAQFLQKHGINDKKKFQQFKKVLIQAKQKKQ